MGGLCFLIHSGNFRLLSGEFISFTFQVITDKKVFASVIYLFSGCHVCILFLNSSIIAFFGYLVDFFVAYYFDSILLFFSVCLLVIFLEVTLGITINILIFEQPALNNTNLISVVTNTLVLYISITQPLLYCYCRKEKLQTQSIITNNVGFYITLYSFLTIFLNFFL